MIEAAVAVALVALIAFGVLSSLTAAFTADRTAQQLIGCRNLAGRTMETVQSTPFDQLLSLDGTVVNQGSATATVSVSQVAVGLIRIEVLAADDADSTVDTQLVTVVAALD